jgi:hypothetical protein
MSRSYAVVGRIQTSTRQKGFRVVSAPVRMRSAVEERQRTFAAIGIDARIVTVRVDTYRLDFGVFPDGAAAQEQARHVRARGYSTTVEPNRVTVYTVVIGPASERVALAIVRTLRADGFSPTIARSP